MKAGLLTCLTLFAGVLPYSAFAQNPNDFFEKDIVNKGWFNESRSAVSSVGTLIPPPSFSIDKYENSPTAAASAAVSSSAAELSTDEAEAIQKLMFKETKTAIMPV